MKLRLRRPGPVTGLKRLAAYVLIAALIVFGSAMAIWGVFFLKEAVASASWPSVEGQVTALELRQRPDGGHTFVVTYEYVVDATRYSGQRNSLGDGLSFGGTYETRDEAKSAAESLMPIGKRLAIFYDPESPLNALVTPGVQWSTFVPVVLGLIFVPTGWFFLNGMRAREAQRHEA